MNAGYMLLSSGDMIYADRTSLLGGICPDESKIIFGPLKQYLSCVTYSFDPSYESEIVSEG